jgi:hypothetical protein
MPQSNESCEWHQTTNHDRLEGYHENFSLKEGGDFKDFKLLVNRRIRLDPLILSDRTSYLDANLRRARILEVIGGI